MASTREMLVRFVGETDASIKRSAEMTSKSIAQIGEESEKTAKRSSAAMGIIAGAAGGLAVKAVDAVIGIAKGAGDFIEDSIAKASGLSETMSKAGVIFGDQASAMEEWASTADRAFGLSKAAALDSAAGFGDMLSQIGFTGDEAANMSKTIIGLGADLGSFNNLETSDVLDKIGASFRGEFDSLQAVIPNINAARVANEALAATGKKSAKDLTAQEKAAATLAIIQKDGARAIGDFERTSTGAANAQKVLSAQVDDLKGKLGEGLLPVLEGSLGFMTDTVMPGLSAAVDRIGPVISRVVDSTKEAKSAFMDGWTFGTDSDELEPSTNPMVNLMRRIGSGVADAQQGFQEFRNGVTGDFTDISDDATPFQRLMFKLGTGIREHVIPAFERMKSTFGDFFDRVRPIVADVVEFVKTKWAEWGPKIEEYTSKITEIVGGAMDLVSAIVERVSNWISDFWDRWGTRIIAIASNAWDMIGNLIGNGLDFIKGIIKTVTGIISGDWDGALQGMQDTGIAIWEGIKTAARGLVDMLGNLFGVSNLTDKITAGFRSALRWINENFIGSINRVISAVGIDWAIPTIPVGGGSVGGPGRGYSATYESGGYTGPGGRSEPAGIVHKGEVVWSQRDVAAWGGPGAVDAMRTWRGYEDGGIVGAALSFIKSPGAAIGRVVESIMGSAPGGLAGAFIGGLKALPRLIGEKLLSFIGGIFGGTRTAGGGLLPVNGVISSPYGFRVGPFNGAELHDGVDIAAPLGSPVVAPLPGAVIAAGPAGGYGNLVRLDHGGLTTFYAHLDTITARLGQVIGRGQMLGTVGSTGWSTGPHLHWGSSNGDPMSLVYDNGGWLRPGRSLIENKTGKPEPILTGDQWASLLEALTGLVIALQAQSDRPVMDADTLARLLAGMESRRGKVIV